MDERTAMRAYAVVVWAMAVLLLALLLIMAATLIARVDQREAMMTAALVFSTFMAGCWFEKRVLPLWKSKKPAGNDYRR